MQTSRKWSSALAWMLFASALLSGCSDDDDGVERTEHRRVQRMHRLRQQRPRLQQSCHDQDVGIVDRRGANSNQQFARAGLRIGVEAG